LCARNSRTRSAFADTPRTARGVSWRQSDQINEFDRFPLKTGKTSGAFEQLPPVALRVDPCRKILQPVPGKCRRT
jgi:hypothetical protein